jgi:ABC-type Fe3+ transport system permease subunit
MIQLHPELEEAARTSGATPAYAVRRIVLPLMLPALVGAWVWVVAHVTREFSTALLLQGDNNAIVSVQLWSYWSPLPMFAAGIGTARFSAENVCELPPIIDGRMALPATPGLGFDPQAWWDAQP